MNSFRAQRLMVLAASVALMLASLRHLATTFCQLEALAPGEVAGSLLSSRCAPALLTAGAVDVCVIVLIRLALSSRELGGRITTILVALLVVTAISVLGNASSGLTAMIAHDGGGSGYLFSLDELRALDWLSIARPLVFTATIPILVLLTGLAGAAAATTARDAFASQEPVITLEAPQAPAKAPVRREPQRVRQLTGGSVSHALLPSGEAQEDPDRISMRGRTTRAERIAIARRVMAGGGGVEEIKQEADVSIRTAFRLRDYIRDEARSAEASGDGRML